MELKGYTDEDIQNQINQSIANGENMLHIKNHLSADGLEVSKFNFGNLEKFLNEEKNINKENHLDEFDEPSNSTNSFKNTIYIIISIIAIIRLIYTCSKI